MSGNTFLRWFNTNLGLLLLALVLAFIAWLSAVFNSDPNEECTAPANIPLEVLNLREDYLLLGDVPEEAAIRLYAPRSVCRRMADDPSSVRAAVDLDNLGPGDHEIDVVYVLDEQYRPVRVLETSPVALSVTVEEFVTRTVPLTLQLTGQPAPGYTQGGSILSDSRVEVSGMRSLVDSVASATVSLDITDAVGDVNVTRPVQLFDAQGTLINGLDIVPSTVSIRKIIVRPGFTRDVSVRVIYSGAPADGYRLTSITPTPQIITVYSNDPELIRELPGFVETETIDLTSATDDIEVRLRLILPTGVFVDGEQNVLVQIGIAAIESSITLTLPVELVGLASGLQATISPESVDVLMTGPLPALTGLQPLDVRVVLDLTGLTVGESPVTPRIEVIPIGITIESILPASIEVVITEAPTPTPGPAGDSPAAPAPTGTP